MIMGLCYKGYEVCIYIMVLYGGMIMGLCNKGYEVCIIWHLLFMLPFEVGEEEKLFAIIGHFYAQALMRYVG